jgi:hypothetical protein
LPSPEILHIGAAPPQATFFPFPERLQVVAEALQATFKPSPDCRQPLLFAEYAAVENSRRNKMLNNLFIMPPSS